MSDKKQKKEIVSKEKLLEAGVYFGHNKSKWNPKMKPYILATKNGTHIIDIQKTAKTLEFAYSIVNKFASRGASFMFVGTRRQAKEAVKQNALRTNSFYVAERWLGGTLTNNRTIFSSVRRMFDLEKLQQNDFAGYTKKEGVLFSKELEKLQKNLYGIKNMKYKPNVMIVADPKSDEIAVKEAKKLGIKVIGIVDTNIDPNLVDVAIPANDDSLTSVSLILTILADAIAAAKGGKQLFAYQNDDAIVLPEDLKPEKPARPKREFNKFNRRPSFKKDENSSENKKPSAKERHSKVPHAKAKPETKTEVKAEAKTDLSTLKVAELRDMAKAKEVKGFSTMKKAELISALS